jgi:hypothetical protein
MHALDQAARTTGEARFNTWARELSTTAFAAFTYAPSTHPEPRRMNWKMSIDLSRALVPSMGQQDPLEGYVGNLQLQATARTLGAASVEPDLQRETREYGAMLNRAGLATADPLGLGGLLIDAWRLRQLALQGAVAETPLLKRLLQAARLGLEQYARSGELEQPARYRLAFRELGLAIGLHALARLYSTAGADTDLRALLGTMTPYLPLRDEIENFWRAPANRNSPTWLEHRDINEVMLATSLLPDGVLDLPAPE